MTDQVSANDTALPGSLPNIVTSVQVDADTAQADFERWVDAMGLDLEVDASFDAEDKKNLSQCKATVLKALGRGVLFVDQCGQMCLKTSSQTFTFRPPTGATMMATDRKGKDAEVLKTMTVLGELTGVHPKVFAAMPWNEVKVASAVMNLFLD